MWIENSFTDFDRKRLWDKIKSRAEMSIRVLDGAEDFLPKDLLDIALEQEKVWRSQISAAESMLRGLDTIEVKNIFSDN